MDYSGYKAIAFRRDGKVLHATFNRPEVLNAFDARLDHEVGTAVRRRCGATQRRTCWC